MDEEFDSFEDAYDDYVPVFYARNADEAEKYCELLDEQDIPTVIGNEEDMDEDTGAPEMTRGMPVMVPEALLDEASEIISETGEIESLDDDLFEDEEEDEFVYEDEEDLFDDDDSDLLGDDDDDLFDEDDNDG